MPDRQPMGEAEVRVSVLLIDQISLAALGIVARDPRDFTITLQVRLQDPLTREVTFGKDELVMVLDVYDAKVALNA